MNRPSKTPGICRIDQKNARADFVVWMDGDLDAHAKQIERILSHL